MGCTQAKELISGKPLDLSGPVGLKHFEIQRVIGEGGYGKVKAVTKKNPEDKKNVKWFAMKVLNKESIVDRGRFKEVFRERDLLTLLRHERICNVYYAFQDRKHLYLVMDIALGGDLRYQLNHNLKGDPFTEERTRIYIAQVALALQYVHSQNVIHRDVKPENILMNAQGWLMLTDFGIARDLTSDGFCFSGSGTTGYMPPEIYHKSRRHGTGVDWFALGVTMHELLTRRRPFRGDQIRRACKRATSAPTISSSGKVRDSLPLGIDKNMGVTTLSSSCVSLLRSLLKANPSERLGHRRGIKELEEHPWFKSFDWEGIRNETHSVPFVPNIKKMNAEPDADIHAVFMGDEEERKLRDLTDDEQKAFQGYEYDYELDSGPPPERQFGSTLPKSPSSIVSDDQNKSSFSSFSSKPDSGLTLESVNSSGSLSGAIPTQLSTPRLVSSQRHHFSFDDRNGTNNTSYSTSSEGIRLDMDGVESDVENSFSNKHDHASSSKKIMTIVKEEDQQQQQQVQIV